MSHGGSGRQPHLTRGSAAVPTPNSACGTSFLPLASTFLAFCSDFIGVRSEFAQLLIYYIKKKMQLIFMLLYLFS